MKKFLLVSAIITLAIIVSFAVSPASVKAESLDECIKKYQAMNLSYDDAKLKCSNTQTQTNVQVAPTSQNQPSPVTAPQTTTNQNVSDPCIKKYMDAYQMSYDEAKLKCYPPTQVNPTAPGTTSGDDCIKKYMSETGNTYEDAKEKCTPITPVYVPSVAPKEGVTPLDSCIQKYLNSGSSYEEAKKNCSQEVPTQNQEPQLKSSIDGCVEKYVSVFNISYAEAKAKCTNVPQASATAVQVIEKSSDCAGLENQLAQLSEKLKTAQGQETESIMAEIKKIKEKISSSCQTAATVAADPCTDARRQIFNYEEQLKKGVSAEEQVKIKNAIEALKTRLQNCGIQQATPTVKNPCDEIPSLKNTYEAMVKKEVQIKDLIEKGQLDKSALDDLYRQMEFLKKKLEQMQFACQQGNKPEESPCSRLAKLELLYSQSQSSDLAKEIIALKERCLAQDLSSEKVDTLADVEEAYKSKLMAVVQGTFGQEQTDNLKQTEDQKGKLVGEMAKNSSELDMRGISIIDKVNISKGKVSLDNIQAPSVPVKINMNGKEMTIDPSKSEITEIDDDITWIVKIDDDITWLTKDGKLVGTNSGKPINILPSEIEDKIGAKPISIEIQDKNGPSYIAKVDANGKLFGFIPISAPKNFQVDAGTGTSQQSNSWWSFLVKY